MPITKLNLPQPGTPEYDDIIRLFEAKEELEGHIGELATRLGDAAQRQHESDHEHRLRMERLKSEVTQDTIITADNQAEVEASLRNLRKELPSVKYIHEAWHGGLHLRISVGPHGPDEISFRFFGDDDSVPDRITVFNIEHACQFARGLILAIVASTDREVGFTMEDFAPGSWDAAPAWLEGEKRERVQRFIRALEGAEGTSIPSDSGTDLDDDRQFLIDYAQQQGRDAQRLMEIAQRLSSG